MTILSSMPPSFALLIAAPHPRDTAMRHDVAAMAAALTERGLALKQIRRLEGDLTAPVIAAFLRDAHARIADWPAGDVFLYYSGHGGYAPLDAETADAARPALLPAADTAGEPAHWLFWDDVFAIIEAPPGVHITLVPDC
jgi:hypothetical protein